MVVVLDQGRDVGFEVFLEEVVFEEDAVSRRLTPAFDLTLCLQMVGSAETLVCVEATMSRKSSLLN